MEPALPDLLSSIFLTQTMVLHSEQPASLPEETQGMLGERVTFGQTPPHLDYGLDCLESVGTGLGTETDRKVRKVRELETHSLSLR